MERIQREEAEAEKAGVDVSTVADFGLAPGERKWRRWTQKECKILLAMKEDGKSTAAIAFELGRNESSVREKFRLLKKNL